VNSATMSLVWLLPVAVILVLSTAVAVYLAVRDRKP
jgi:hypothetical protein